MSGSVLSPTAFAQEYNLLPAAGASSTPASPVVVYTTVQNDRWDLISWALYGTITHMQDLINNNPQLPINCQLPQGLQVYAPILQPQQATVSSPWTP